MPIHITLREAAMHDDYCLVYCGNHLCDHKDRMEFRPLIRRYGENYGLDGILGRMRCKICGHLGATVRAASHDPDRPARPLYDPVTGERLGE
tara:strand:+ start:3583 stop:3858 length:276 start_codon:yes stop_codon:yes gene_type:complete